MDGGKSRQLRRVVRRIVGGFLVVIALLSLIPSDDTTSTSDLFVGAAIFAVVGLAIALGPELVRGLQQRPGAPSGRPVKMTPREVHVDGSIASVVWVVGGLLALGVAIPMLSLSKTGAPITGGAATGTVTFVAACAWAARPFIERALPHRHEASYNELKHYKFVTRLSLAVVPAVFAFLITPLSGSGGTYFYGAFMSLLLLIPAVYAMTVKV